MSTKLPNIAKIPTYLANRQQWIAWRYESRDGKPSKPPIDHRSNGQLRYAETDDPRTWTDLATAIAYCERHQELEGIGYCFWKKDGLTGIDLDHVFNAATGEIDPKAVPILERFKGTYIEVSPSGEGFHIICKGKIKGSGKNVDEQKGDAKWLEAYTHPSNRYFTFTGNQWPDSANEPTAQQEALDWLYGQYMKKGEKPTGGGDTARSKATTANFAAPLTDDEVLEKARKAKNGALFERLWAGDTSGHGGDASAADMALCNLLAFWTGGSAEQMDRLFRRSGLMRDKWNETHYADGRTYGQGTIEEAISTTPTMYVGGGGAAKKKKENLLLAVADILEKSEAWEGVIAFNRFRERIEKRATPPFSHSRTKEWSDVDTGETTLWLAENAGLTVPVARLESIIQVIAHRNGYNPAQDRLNEFAKGWDKTPRLNRWLIDYLGAEEEAGNAAYLRELGERWLIGVCARVMQPGCKRDDVLTLVGPQGAGKSRAARAIADSILPDSFTDSLGNLGSDEARLNIRGKIIAELGELSAVARSELEAVKCFVSASTDSFREKYERHTTEHPRTVSFIATTNEDCGFLTDPSGNRRWWPVTVKQGLKINRLTEDLPQLLGEAVTRYQDGEQWHVFDQEALQQAEAVRRDHHEMDVWEESVLRVMRMKKDRDRDPPTIAVILDELGKPFHTQTRTDAKRVGNILRHHGFRRKSFRNSEGLVENGWIAGA